MDSGPVVFIESDAWEYECAECVEVTLALDMAKEDDVEGVNDEVVVKEVYPEELGREACFIEE